MKNQEDPYGNAGEAIKNLTEETSQGYLGKPEVVELLVQALVSGLHTLIEDVSGVGKTTLVKCLVKASGLDYGRIQFTPDLLPGDITGMTIWDPVKREFLFKPGPVHRQFLLADELNRAPARTQSALLEAMQEGAVTVEGRRNPLPEPFFVAATQNPEWYAGTYILPESQLDRFGIRIIPGYPDGATEASVLGIYKNTLPEDRVQTVSDASEILSLRSLIRDVHLDPAVLDYAVSLGAKTRASGEFQTGLSTRGLQHLIRLAQSRAVLQGRGFVIPEDLLHSIHPVMEHRLVLTPESRSEGRTAGDLIDKIAAQVPLPVGFRRE